MTVKQFTNDAHSTHAFFAVMYLRTLDWHYFGLMKLARSQYERILEVPEYYEHPAALTPLPHLFPQFTNPDLPF